MNFQDLKRIEKPDHYLDVAFSRARERTLTAKEKKVKDRIAKKKFIEISRLETVEGSLTSKLTAILKSYPSIDTLPDFYLELLKVTLDYPYLKKSLGAVNWAIKSIKRFTNEYVVKIRKTPDIPNITKMRTQYYGRVSSVMKQIRKELGFLEEARKTMRSFPTIKTSMFTVAICGFPNVGKTTLLSRMSGSTPEIKDYAFTTKRINVGYIQDEKIQLLDTPGTLNRQKMNYIEKQADLAMKHCSHAYVYVFDLTEPYPLKDQVKLYRLLKKDKAEMIVYISKTDICEDKEFRKKYSAITDPEALKEKLIQVRSRTFP